MMLLTHDMLTCSSESIKMIEIIQSPNVRSLNTFEVVRNIILRAILDCFKITLNERSKFSASYHLTTIGFKVMLIEKSHVM